MGIADVSPGARPEVFDQLDSIALRIQGNRKAGEPRAQIFRLGRIANAGLRGPLHQQLENSPGVEAGRVLQQKLPLVRRVCPVSSTNRPGASTRSLLSICPRSWKTCSLPGERLVVRRRSPASSAHPRPSLGRPDPSAAQQPMKRRRHDRAANEMVHHAEMLLRQRQQELLQRKIVRMDLQKSPSFQVPGTSCLSTASRGLVAADRRIGTTEREEKRRRQRHRRLMNQV